jgi:hypothetical protein
MRTLSVVLSLFLFLPLLISRAQAQDPPASSPPPTNFDPKTPAPPNLPAKLDIPINIHIDVTVRREKTLPPLTPDELKSPALLWNPDLESATIERNERDVHAVFQWQGGHSSEAFIIRGLCFKTLSLAYPDAVAITGPALDLWVGRLDPGEGSNGDFPDISWYTPSTYAGTASLNQNDVLVFAPGDKKPATTIYPEGTSLCLDAKTLWPVWLDDGVFIYTFTYTPDSNVQINPQGRFLKAIQRKFGQYP